MKKKKIPYAIVIVFGAVYALISIVNHYNFRTYALDLGIYNQALYHYAHFNVCYSTVLKPDFGNILSDHLELLIPLVSPLYYLFGTYTLLIVQICFVLAGGLGIRRFLINKGASVALSTAAMIQYYAFFGIFSALAFDFHSNVIAAGLLPWFFVLFDKRKIAYSAILFMLILLSKENMAFWMFFVSVGLLAMSFKDKEKRFAAIIFSVFALVYFVCVINIIIPGLAPEGRRYQHFQFTALGVDFSEALTTVVTRPVYALKLLFINHTNALNSDFVKTEFFVFLLLSGGVFLFFKPSYLIMILPLIAQKMFNDFSETWGVSAHYNVEFAPVLVLASFEFISKVNLSKVKKVLSVAVPLLALGVTFKVCDKTIGYVDHARIRIYQSMHYERAFNVKDIYALMNQIPDNASVSAQNSFVPHLAFRNNIYSFPEIKDSEYLLLSPLETAYPLSDIDFKQKIDSITSSESWTVISRNESAILFKRKQLP